MDGWNDRWMDGRTDVLAKKYLLDRTNKNSSTWGNPEEKEEKRAREKRGEKIKQRRQ
jgi:hypothetical protein